MGAKGEKENEFTFSSEKQHLLIWGGEGGQILGNHSQDIKIMMLWLQKVHKKILQIIEIER